jgi:hypothetical protein
MAEAIMSDVDPSNSFSLPANARVEPTSGKLISRINWKPVRHAQSAVGARGRRRELDARLPGVARKRCEARFFQALKCSVFVVKH